jgi:hypothetical protein
MSRASVLHAKQGESPRILRLLPFPLLAVAAAPIGHVMAGAGQSGTSGAGLHLVVAPPWRYAEALIALAGGRIVGPEQAPLGRFAISEAPDFASRARTLGLLVLDARRVAFLCRTDT